MILIISQTCDTIWVYVFCRLRTADFHGLPAENLPKADFNLKNNSLLRQPTHSLLHTRTRTRTGATRNTSRSVITKFYHTALWFLINSPSFCSIRQIRTIHSTSYHDIKSKRNMLLRIYAVYIHLGPNEYTCNDSRKYATPSRNIPMNSEHTSLNGMNWTSACENFIYSKGISLFSPLSVAVLFSFVRSFFFILHFNRRSRTVVLNRNYERQML